MACTMDVMENREPGRRNWLVSSSLLLFLIVCIFDPADVVVGGKVPVFLLAWLLTALTVPFFRARIDLPAGLVLYVAAFIAIPLISIVCYYVFDGRQPFEGFAMLKGYLLISLAVVLVINKIDLLPGLSAVLTLLACLVIAVFVVIMLEPDSYAVLKRTMEPGGLLLLDKRSYGDDVTLLQVYFVTSPMLAISIAHYFDRAMVATGKWRRLGYMLIAAINVAGMFLAGTRNNIFVSILLPFLLWPLYTRRPLRNLLGSVALLAVVALVFAQYFSAFLDPDEQANKIKLAILADYVEIFSDPVTLLFGQGLGAYYLWAGKEVLQSTYITELTYLEMLRNFGLIGATAMMGLILFPVASAFAGGSKRDKSVAIAWLLYLVMCFSNPNLFSSMGMLILAALLANVFREWDAEHSSRARAVS